MRRLKIGWLVGRGTGGRGIRRSAGLLTISCTPALGSEAPAVSRVLEVAGTSPPMMSDVSARPARAAVDTTQVQRGAMRRCHGSPVG